MTQADFFSGIKDQFGIEVPEKDWDRFAVNAALMVNDLRLVLLRHQDQEMVESSCLHFLGDEAQIWWAERNKDPKPTITVTRSEHVSRKFKY